MMTIKNIDTMPPKWWNRLEMGLIVILIPAFTGFVTDSPMSDSRKVWFLASAPFLSAVVRFIGILTGSTPDPKNPDTPQ